MKVPVRHAAGTEAAPPAPLSLDHVRCWVFDLDNTLYAPDLGLLDQVDRLMTDFIARKLRVSEAEASRLRGTYWERHGATMTGLVEEHGVDPDEFLAACHVIDLDGLRRNDPLAAALAGLPGRRIIHTNGPRHHAERVLDAIGIADRFDQVIAIEDTGYRPKPDPLAHDQAVDLGAFRPAEAAMIDDMAQNLAHPAALGMTTIWVRHDPLAARPGHADHLTDDLTGFLVSAGSGPSNRAGDR